jgi:hypothetical protein
MAPERNKEKRQNKDYQFRQSKKIIKENIKHAKNKKDNFIYDEDDISHILPSGDFDKKLPEKKDEDKEIKPSSKEVQSDDKLGYIGDLDDEGVEEEEFDDSYFEQQAYVKK